MSVIYLKQFKGKERKEVKLENWESLTVKKLKETVSKETGIPQDELTLIFNGRVLKSSNSLSKYKMSIGCTVFYTKKVTKLSAPQQETQEYDSTFNALVSNRRVLTMIGRMLSNPSLLNAMLAGTPLEGDQALTAALSNPELLSSLSDPDTIKEYLSENPHMAILMENMLRMHQFGLGDGVGGSEGVEGAEAMEMMEESLEEDIDEGQQQQSRMAQEQEDMFQHSQAIHAHQQQVQVTTDPPRGSSGDRASSLQHQSGASVQYSSVQRQNSGGAITQDLLSTALAEAMGGSQQSSPLSSLSISNSGPPSLSAYTNQPTTQPVQASNGSGRSEIAGSIHGNPQPNITNEAFQQALASAFSNIPAPSSSQSRQESGRRRLTPQEKYRAQLEQMHLMGIMDDTVSIQALDATGGDLQAALEIIYSR